MLSLCFITTPSKAVAKQLATMLVQEHRAAACVNILPSVTSVYEWDGALCEDEECLMLVKTQTCCVPQVTSLVKQHHPYDCPEVIAVALQEGMGSADYLEWVRKQTSRRESGEDTNM